MTSPRADVTAGLMSVLGRLVDTAESQGHSPHNANRLAQMTACGGAIGVTEAEIFATSVA